MKGLLPILSILTLAAIANAQTPTKVYSTNCENSSALNGSPWAGVTPPYNYYCKVNPNAIISGNTIVVSVGYDYTGGNETFQVTDDQNNSYSSIVTSTTSHNRRLQTFYASNITGGVTTIDVRMTAGTLEGYWEPTIAEFDNTGAADASGCASGSSTSIAAASLTPTQTGDLLYQVFYYPSLSYGTVAQSGLYTAGSNSNIAWAIWLENLPDGSAGQYGVYSSTSAITPTMTASTSQNYISCAVAFKAASSGGAQSTQLIDHERMALPKNGANPLILGMNVTGTTLIMTYLSNDAPNPATCCAISSTPALTWSQSGADGTDPNGDNHSDIYCAHSTSAIGPIKITINRAGSTRDGIFHLFDLQGVSCNVDYDSGATNGALYFSANQTTSGNAIDMCTSPGHSANCITLTTANDWIIGNFGEYWGTVTGLVSPTPSYLYDDAGYFTGNTVDGYSQTDENNGFFAGTNGGSTGLIDVKTIGAYTGGAPYPSYWGGRVAAFKPLLTPAAPYGLTGVVR